MEKPEVSETQEQGNLVLTKGGKPFKTEQAANLVRSTKGLGNSHDVVPYAEGYALQDRKIPQPQPGEQGQNLPQHERTGQPPKPAAPVSTRGDAPSRPPAEKFHRVKFQNKSHANDPDSVELACNGEVLQIQRGVEVVIPERFKEIADHAVEPQYRQVPGEERKVVGEVRRWPYDWYGEATREEYLQMKAAGAKARGTAPAGEVAN